MYGAWIIILLIPMIVPVFVFIHKHYNRVAEQLRLLSMQAPPPQTIEHSVLMPIDDVNYASLRAMSFARTISKDITVIHIGLKKSRKKCGPMRQTSNWSSWNRRYAHLCVRY
jgi:hypothetical protein